MEVSVILLRRLQILLAVNFFILAIALMTVYLVAWRLRYQLKISNKLRESAEVYRALVNTATEGIFRCNTEGKIILINDSGARILGHRDQMDLLGRELKSLDLYLDSSMMDTFVNHVLTRGSMENQRILARRHDGSVFHLEYTGNPVFDESGENVVGFQGIFRDISRQIQLEKALKQYSTELEKMVEEKTREVIHLERRKSELEKLASLGKMAAMIVHEVRNPLSSIKVGLSTILKRADLMDRDRQCLTLATQEVHSLERILQDLLGFARPGELQLQIQDLNQIVEMAVSQLRMDIEEEGITLETDLGENLPLIAIDHHRMLQVFYNLLLNAKQSMSRGGRISIRSLYDRAAGCVHIEVADTGKGISKKHMNKIFDPFFSTRSQGTGLGLTVVYSLVRAHGGDVLAESDEGHGTQFTVTLPVNGPSQSDQGDDRIDQTG
jgi:PAS domain S-box-containing protein